MLRIINIITRYYINSTLYRYTIYTFLAFLEKDQNRQRFILELVNSNNSFEARWIRLFFTLPHLYPHRSLSTRFVSSSFNKQLTTWKKRNAKGTKRGSLDQDRIVRIQEFTTRDCLEIVKRSADILHVEESRQGKLDSHLAGRPSTLSATYDTSIKMVPSCPNYERNSISVKENYTKDSLFPIG